MYNSILLYLSTTLQQGPFNNSLDNFDPSTPRVDKPGHFTTV
jgi:hypothetical protein